MGFLDEPEDKKEESQEQEVEKIKIGDVEFDPSELESMVGKYKDVEERAKGMGGIDKVVSYAGDQARQVGELKAQLEAEKAAKKQEEPKREGSEPTQEDILKAAEEQGFITRSTINNYLTQYRAAEKLVDEVKDYEKQGNPYEAKDLPKFDANEMLDYMNQTGIKNPRSAYNDKYEKEIDAWKQKQLSSSRPSGMVTQEQAPGNKQPKMPKLTRDNLGAAIGAVLNHEI